MHWPYSVSPVTRETTSTLEFPYSRTLGPVVGAFFAGLREHTILGVRTGDGRVLVPPLEYDPNTGEALAPSSSKSDRSAPCESWTWVSEPTPKHPLDRPFAFAFDHARRRRHRDGARGRRRIAST